MGAPTLSEAERRLLIAAPYAVWFATSGGELLWGTGPWHLDPGVGERQPWWERVHPLDRARCRDQFLASSASKETFHLTFRLSSSAGGLTAVNADVLWHTDDAGAPDGLLAYVREAAAEPDLLAELEAQRAEIGRLSATMRQGGHFISDLLNAVPDWISYIDTSFRITYVNQNYERWIGRPANEVVGQRVDEVLGPTMWTQVKEHAQAAARGEAREFEMTRPRVDGTTAHLRVRYLPDSDEATSVVRGYVAIIVDVTDAWEAQRRVVWSEDMLTRALAAAGMCAWSWDPQRRTTTRAENAQAVMGVAPDTTATALSMSNMHPEDIERMNAVVREAIETMQPYSLRYRWQRPDNGEWVWLETHGDVRRLDDGELRIYGVAADVTLRQEAEDALQRALKVREELLGLVSHELRTPLTTLNGNISVLKRRRDTLDATTLAEVIGDLESDAQRLQRIVENMLTLARTDLDATEDFEPLVLGRVVAAEIADHARRAAGPPVTFSQPAEALVALGNEMQIRQVVGNLLSNAVKYGRGSDAISVTLAKDGPDAVLSVEDHGIGLSEEARASVFEAFYRSAEASTTAAGVGLGLTVCQRLVELHGGRIWVDSAPGRTVFSFTIPLVPETD